MSLTTQETAQGQQPSPEPGVHDSNPPDDNQFVQQDAPATSTESQVFDTDGDIADGGEGEGQETQPQPEPVAPEDTQVASPPSDGQGEVAPPVPEAELDSEPASPPGQEDSMRVFRESLKRKTEGEASNSDAYIHAVELLRSPDPQMKRAGVAALQTIFNIDPNQQVGSNGQQQSQPPPQQPPQGSGPEGQDQIVEKIKRDLEAAHRRPVIENGKPVFDPRTGLQKFEEKPINWDDPAWQKQLELHVGNQVMKNRLEQIEQQTQRQRETQQYQETQQKLDREIAAYMGKNFPDSVKNVNGRRVIDPKQFEAFKALTMGLYSTRPEIRQGGNNPLDVAKEYFRPTTQGAVSNSPPLQGNPAVTPTQNNQNPGQPAQPAPPARPPATGVQHAQPPVPTEGQPGGGYKVPASGSRGVSTMSLRDRANLPLGKRAALEGKLPGQ